MHAYDVPVDEVHGVHEVHVAPFFGSIHASMQRLHVRIACNIPDLLPMQVSMQVQKSSPRDVIHPVTAPLCRA